MKKYKLLLILLLIIALCIGGYYAWRNNLCGIRIKEIESSEDTADFELRMLDVGQGLAVLVKCDGKYLLYDGGDRTTSAYMVSYLKEHEINTLDYIVASHYDDDHISGLIGVLNTTNVGTAIIPDYVNDTSTYYSFQNMLSQSSAVAIHPTVGDSFSLGSAKIEIIGPQNYEYENDNDKSIAMRITYGSFSIMLTGDAEATAENDMVASGIELRTDIYVVGHHGSSKSSSKKLLAKMHPSYAFISAGEGNDYGHPHKETLRRLKRLGCSRIFRTDQDGAITAYISADKIWFKTDRSKALSNTSYVLNNNNHKFHNPDCESVADIKEYNRENTNLSREELIEMGYEPCGRCRP